MTTAWKPRKVASFEARRDVEDELLGQVIAECKRFHAVAATDQYASKAVCDRSITAGIVTPTHMMTASSKTAIYGELRSRLYDGSLACPDDPELVAELRRLRSKFSAGSSTVVNPGSGAAAATARRRWRSRWPSSRGSVGRRRAWRAGGRPLTQALRDRAL